MISTLTKAKNPRARRRLRKAPVAGGRGAAARAMFSRWAKGHHDAKPLSWEKFKATLEQNRLRETPLFAHE